MGCERDFAAWIERRDAAALARVFDATAGKLLLLAAHVAPRGTAPEDLVQATFLAAMGRSASWDAERPLWPWLAAILHNEASMARRRELRRREVELDEAAGAAAPGAGGDPAQAAASEEMLAAVLAAIEALPLPYRQVLRLRLVHGLQPMEIARALEVPVGTVRAQLHRGLARLRAALPAGVGAAVGALLLGDGAPRAQARAEVLTRASELGTATAAAPASGATAADGTFRCDLDAFRERTTLFRRTSYVFVTATAPSGGTSMNVIELPRTLEPRPLASEVRLNGDRLADTWLFGRVVDGSGAPVPDAQLGLVRALGGRFDARHESIGADGAFRIRVAGGEEQSIVAVAAVHPALGTALALVPRTTPSGAGAAVGRDVGALVLKAGGTIRGQVVLGDGSPLGGFRVFAQPIDPAAREDAAVVRSAFFDRSEPPQPLALSVGRVQQTRAETTTAEDGSFAFAALDPAGCYAIGVRDCVFHWFAVAVRPGEPPVRIAVDRQLLSIDVRGEAGEILPGARIVCEGFDPARTGLGAPVEAGYPTAQPVVRNPFLSIDAQGRRMLLAPFGWVFRMACGDDIAEPDAVRHEVLAGVHRAECRLALRAVTEFGALRIVVADEAGKPLEHYGALLRCLDRDLRYGGLASNLPPGGHRWELPAGRWHVAVHLGKLVHWRGFVAVRARGVQEHEVRIEAGETTELRVVAEPKGSVAFRLRSDRPPAKEWGWQDVVIRPAPGGHPLDLQHDPEHWPPAGTPGPVGPGADSFFSRQAFAPGRHSFWVSASGYLPARCDVEVVADRLTTADVELLPQ